MLNMVQPTKVRKSRTLHIPQIESPRHLSLNPLIQRSDMDASLYEALNVDVSNFRLTLLNCRNRRELMEKVYWDLLYQNKCIRNSIKCWFQAQKSVPYVTPRKSVKAKLPRLPVTPRACAQTLIPKACERHAKKAAALTLNMGENPVPITQMEFSATPKAQRLHAPSKLKAVIEVKILHDNKLVVISNNQREYRSLQKYKPRLAETAYDYYFLNRIRRRQVGGCVTEADSYRCFGDSNQIDQKIQSSKF